MKEIRIWYTSPGIGSYTDAYFTPLLRRRFNIVLDPIDPQYVITSTAARDHRVSHFSFPNAVKIFFTGENIVPDFNLYDYALGFHNLTFGDRYMRFPLWLLYYAKIKEAKSNSGQKFCNFVYSNNYHSHPMRLQLLEAVEEIGRVDCGGALRNNIGNRVRDKMEFLRDYRFTIAVENSQTEGYTTEKLLEPLMMGSVPIYWGNPNVDMDFNIDRIVLVRGADDLPRVLDEIRYLNDNPHALFDKNNQPMLSKGTSIEGWEDLVLDFFEGIFSQSHAAAFRREKYGYNCFDARNKQRFEGLISSKWGLKVLGAFERFGWK